MPAKKRVMIALSGGVDSSVAAALLMHQDFCCEAVFMLTCDEMQSAKASAQKAADRLGIKLHILDLRADFEHILDYFCAEYRNGRTPNPCVLCNKLIKFGKLWDFAQTHGATSLATGHYARVIKNDNGADLFRAADETKDQSYALSMINKSILPNIILPMGEYSKEQTLKLAKDFDLGTETNKESQEICFIPGNDYVSVLEHRCPALIRKGKIIDSNGKVLGEHEGIHRFTIGQRRGLRVAMGKPYYVTKIDVKANTVILGPKQEVMHKKFSATGVNWLIERPNSEFYAKVKIRYNSASASATVYPQKDVVIVEFDNSVSAITPGQLACFYISEGPYDKVAGGAWIEQTIN